MLPKHTVLFFDYLNDINYLHASGSGLGSSIFKLTALKDAQKHNFEVHLLTNPTKKLLLSGAIEDDKIYTDESSIDFSNFDICINLGLDEEQIPNEIKKLKGYHPFLESDRKRYKNEAHISFWRSFCSTALKYQIENHHPDFEISTSEDEIAKVKKVIKEPYKYLTLSYQTISPLKDYPYWHEVIDLLIEDHNNLKIILVGHTKQIIKEQDKLINMTGRTDITLLKALVSQSNIVVGVDGLTTNIAMALNTPAVILFSMIAPEKVIPDLKNSKLTYLTAPGCEHQFCYKSLINYRNSKCQFLEENPNANFPECLNFSPQAVAKSISQYL